MKTSSLPHPRLLGIGALSLICLLAIPQNADAKGPKGFSKGHNNSSKNHKRYHDKGDDRARQAYSSHSRSGFVLALGNGYAGKGYYYGPPNSSYYYQRSDVRYYATRDSAPREYYARDDYRGNGNAYSVQKELSRRGYYQGSMDGRIGPQSQRSIYRYQQDRGMRSTGTITSELLSSLGL